MSRLIAILLFLLMLVGCSSQEESPNSETWTWVFEDGTVIEFPD